MNSNSPAGPDFLPLPWHSNQTKWKDFIEKLGTWQLKFAKTGEEAKHSSLPKLMQSVNDRYRCAALKHIPLDFFEDNGPFDLMLKTLLEATQIITVPPRLTKRGQPSTVTLTKKQVFLLMCLNFFEMFNNRFTDLLSNKQLTLCMTNYYRRSFQEAKQNPAWWDQVITIERRVLMQDQEPDWNDSTKKLRGLQLHTTRIGIEDFRDAYQVNFADPYPGGTLPSEFPDIVQEEILFLIYPEMFITSLFVQKIYDNESIILSGVTRTNKYTGYQSNFRYDGNYVEDSKSVSIIFIDALPGGEHGNDSFMREINKAYIGFSCNTNGRPIATGHWGCGAFGGNHKFKAVLQLIAAAEAERDLLYTTFGTNQYTNDLMDNYNCWLANNVTVGELFSALKGKYVGRKYPLFKRITKEISEKRRKEGGDFSAEMEEEDEQADSQSE